MPECPSCAAEVLDIDVRCASCGAPVGSTGAHRLVGSVVLGQYEIIDVLGQGGMSVVYRARHKITEQEVALKLLPPELAAHSQVKGRFLEEAKALAQLDHANIVHLYNFGQENGAFVLAMQFVVGQTWERIIMTKGRQDWPTATRIAIDVLRALEYAHGRGIIHRDMKPSNVLVRDADGAGTVMDFGIAKMTTSTRLTATGQTMGTVRYMSPEQVRGQEVDLRTDIYSLGATLYEALVGDTPFDGDTHFEIMTKHLHEAPRAPSSHGVELPASLEAAVLRALAKKPDDRFQSARELRKELEAVLKDADMGLAVTQRLARDSMPPGALPNPPRPVATPVAVTAPGTRVAAAKRAPEPTGLADRLEPTASELTPPRRRTALWLALGGVVVAGGVTVAVLTTRGSGGASAKAPATRSADAAVGTRAPAKAFLPPDLAITATEASTDPAVTVHVANDWAPADVIRAWGQTRDRYLEFAKERQVTPTLSALTVVVVPSRVLCDQRTYENGAVPADCKDMGNLYRPLEKTLLVVDDREHLALNLGVGLASAACVDSGDGPTCDLVPTFEDQLRTGS